MHTYSIDPECERLLQFSVKTVASAWNTKTSEGYRKKKYTKNQTDIRLRLKQQNIYYFGCMTSPNCQSSIFQFKTSYWYVLITIGILFKITLRILIGRSTISCETLANIIANGITEKMHGAEHSTHLVTMY